MNASFLITYCERHTEQRSRLLTTVGWLAAEAPSLPLLVVEQGLYPRLTAALPHPLHQVRFCHNPHGFNRGWGLNVGARMSAAPVLVFGDADLLVPGRLRGLVDACEQRFAVVKPHASEHALSQADSEDFQLGGPQAASLAPELHERVGLGRGVLAMQRNAFFHVGAWDERFVGPAGGEDHAMAIRVERAQRQTRIEPGAAWRLWAAPEEPPDDQALAKQQGLLNRLRESSDLQLGRMAEVQRQIMGNPEKYRPLESLQ